jgi:hypothetical protein
VRARPTDHERHKKLSPFLNQTIYTGLVLYVDVTALERRSFNAGRGASSNSVHLRLAIRAVREHRKQSWIHPVMASCSVNQLCRR